MLTVSFSILMVSTFFCCLLKYHITQAVQWLLMSNGVNGEQITFTFPVGEPGAKCANFA